MSETIYNEKAIRMIVKCAVESYANGFSTRHLAELDDENGVINMKIHNVFIAALGPEIQYYSALARSLDSSLGNILGFISLGIAGLNYEVNQHVEGLLYKEQTDYIAELLEQYKRSVDRRVPKVADYRGITNLKGDEQTICCEGNYYLIDIEKNMHYIVNLKNNENIECDKIYYEKKILLEQYCILANKFGEDNVKILFATAYNRYGEGRSWTQGHVRQFFSEEELCISRDFWNLVCKSDHGYEIIIDEYKKNSNVLLDCFIP